MPSATTKSDAAATGVYGFRISGLESSDDLLIPARQDWPLLEVSVRIGRVQRRVAKVFDEHAELNLIEGIAADLHRSPPRVEFVMPAPISPKAIVHPFLSGVLPIHCYWMDRMALHGGAFIHNDLAWVVLGSREGGKSTLLAQLAAQGIPILADDLVVVADDRTYAGPRSVDLRAKPPKGIGPAESLGKIGARERWRIHLGLTPTEVPLGGFFFLTWSDTSEVRRLQGPDRLVRISNGRSLMLPLRDPMTLPRLAALPGWEVKRPHRLEDLPTITERMLGAIAVG